jgi:hypothetical protein
MNSRLGTLLDWTLADFSFLGIAIWQYISVTRDLKRSKAREAAERQAAEQNAAGSVSPPVPGHPEGQ